MKKVKKQIFFSKSNKWKKNYVYKEDIQAYLQFDRRNHVEIYY